MSAAAGSVIVVGGGVIGAACAYYLSRAGRSVTLRTTTAANDYLSPGYRSARPWRALRAGGSSGISVSR